MSPLAQQALGNAKLTEDMARVGIYARDKTVPGHPMHAVRIKSFLAAAMKKAMGLVFVRGTGEIEVADLDRHNREWFDSLCIEGGVIFGECKEPREFIMRFGEFLDRIIAMRDKPAAESVTSA